MSEEMEEVNTRRRCHHCNRMTCNHFGEKRVVENCPDFVLLDPALRKHTWEYGDRRRIRIKKKITLTPESIDFLTDVVLVEHAFMMQGRLTRAIHYCADEVLRMLDGNIPTVPKRIVDENSSCVIPVDITMLPETMDGIDKVFNHWKGGENEVSRSRVIDYFVCVMKQAHEIRQKESD